MQHSRFDVSIKEPLLPIFNFSHFLIFSPNFSQKTFAITVSCFDQRNFLKTMILIFGFFLSVFNVARFVYGIREYSFSLFFLAFQLFSWKTSPVSFSSCRCRPKTEDAPSGIEPW